MTNDEMACERKSQTPDGWRCHVYGLDMIGNGLECARCTASGGKIVTAQQLRDAPQEEIDEIAKAMKWPTGK